MLLDLLLQFRMQSKKKKIIDLGYEKKKKHSKDGEILWLKQKNNL